MLRTVHRFALGFMILAGMLLGTTAFGAVPRLDDEAPGPIVARDWRGGPVSLPIGRGHSESEVLAASFELPQTQELIASFLERGYIRRPDQDRGGSSDSIAFAFLAWQKPGVPTISESPLIRVLSKRYVDPDAGQAVVETQAFGGVLRDSSGTLVTYMNGPDAPIVVGEAVPPGTPGAIEIDRTKLPQSNDTVAAYRLSLRENYKRAGVAYKDAMKASCPWRRTLTRYAIIGGAAGLGATSALSGNVWAAIGLAVAAEASTQWIESKWKCN